MIQGRVVLATGNTNLLTFNLTAQHPKIFYRVFKRSRTKFNSKLNAQNVINWSLDDSSGVRHCYTPIWLVCNRALISNHSTTVPAQGIITQIFQVRHCIKTS